MTAPEAGGSGGGQTEGEGSVSRFSPVTSLGQWRPRVPGRDHARRHAYHVLCLALGTHHPQETAQHLHQRVDTECRLSAEGGSGGHSLSTLLCGPGPSSLPL